MAPTDLLEMHMTSEYTALEQSRSILHRVAAHVLARRRWEVTGRFGLRISPGGIATPAFGPETESLRTAGSNLVREGGGSVAFMTMHGQSLRALAAFAGADLQATFSCGDDTPALGDPDEPLELVGEHLNVLVEWFEIGWRVLDVVTSALPSSAAPAASQLWPEHFDIGTNIGLVRGDRVNLGCSPGDGYEAEPYLYVGPRGPARPGDASYWNAPFGALLRRSDVDWSKDAISGGVRFMEKGIQALNSDEFAR